MTNLTWFQYDVDVWHERMEQLALSAEEEGVLMRLFRRAWNQPVPCTILDSHDEFARILGARWRKHVPLIYRFFAKAEGHPDRLVSAWLAEIYNRGVKKHESYVNRGKQGGRPKKERKPQLVRGKAEKKAEVNDSRSSASIPLARESSTEGNSSTTAIPPAPGVAHDGAAPAGAEPPKPKANSQHAAYEERVNAYRLARPKDAVALEAESREELSAEHRRSLTREDDFRVLERMIAKLDAAGQPARAVGDGA